MKRFNIKTAIGSLKFIGPGLLVTVGFIDPGNWASNIAAGSTYGYALLWTVTLSTIMLIILQHNAAHLGIVTGKCLSEATTAHTPKWIGRPVLSTAVIASIATATAEILGAAIALQMLTGLPLIFGAMLATVAIIFFSFTNSYKKIEKVIMLFVSLIGIAFLFELTLVNIDWPEAIKAWVTPSIPPGSMVIIMSVLGAVVMPHNLFLHSETIQNQKINLESEATIEKRLQYEFADTLVSMIIGWMINSAMILVSVTFFNKGIEVTELAQAEQLLVPLLGNGAAIVFAVALLFAGIASSITAGMAGGSIYAGIFGKSYDAKDKTSRHGILITLLGGLFVIFFIGDPFKGLIISQMLLSIQLPITIFLQIYLTSSAKVMGKHKNSLQMTIALWTIGGIVTMLNIFLLISQFI
ncbi:Nramp family divalent metal transporter [Culicoidibacter larvae]|uniref:Divalent metal cation transporter n=1 Tax=Culicoidibacter larvae TaxID=2579976 RepID=A0A5R8Q8I9_9FIRM|nr:Nramp family divalent metal transporter [Culicoidibacter larvae]TLG71811.1 divalent metal cation transporter [Culicoidibacter larvae]